MASTSELRTGLQRELEGHDIVRAMGRSCPSCGWEYDHGERLAVTVSRGPETDEWSYDALVCADCAPDALPDGGDPERERVLVGVTAVATPGGLVLDGDSATIIDRSPAQGRSS
jgi:hypothetical protein